MNKGMRRFSLLIALTVTINLGAQVSTSKQAVSRSHLAVELGHPIYAVIEAAELRGALNRLSSVKPYTRAQIAELLATIQGRLGLFSLPEREEIARLSAEFSAGSKGDIGQALWRASNDKAAVGAHIEATGRFDAAGLADAAAAGLSGASFSGDPADLWHLNSMFQAYVKMYPESWLSLWGTIGVTYDKIERDLYMPYSFTKEWDSYHNKVSTSPTTDGEEDYPTWSFDLQSDIAGASDSGAFTYRLSRFRRDWGMGSGSLSLSGTARPFMGLEFQFRPSQLFSISHLVGSLGNWEKGGVDKETTKDLSGNYTAITEQKMFAIQRLELFPFPWLTLGASGTMIGSKRFELGYLSPMMFAVEYQVTVSDIDNMALQGDIQILLKGIGKLYASAFVDEMELSGPGEWFSRPRNMFAYQGGADFALPLLPFGILSAQYTKIEPFVYAHYPVWTHDSRLRVDESYTHDGENLGYYLPPNSDELSVRVDTQLGSGWRLSFGYRLIRHGDNEPASGKTFLTDWQIYGDVDKYQDYGNLDKYPDKDFLHDGIYEYHNIGEVQARWRPPAVPELLGVKIPLELSIGYGLSHSRYEDGQGLGRAVPGVEWRSVLNLNAKFFL
ncbi:MAG: hypothetical protein RBT73_09620 [Spirochaetia bacterium]|jgi:hypothetical protein|nr:hypothetical protein [Spirochaetia bacterium]